MGCGKLLGCKASELGFLSCCAGLQQVSLVSLPQLTNAGVVGLGGLASLRRVTLSKCPHICEAGPAGAGRSLTA